MKGTAMAFTYGLHFLLVIIFSNLIRIKFDFVYQILQGLWRQSSLQWYGMTKNCNSMHSRVLCLKMLAFQTWIGGVWNLSWSKSLVFQTLMRRVINFCWSKSWISRETTSLGIMFTLVHMFVHIFFPSHRNQNGSYDIWPNILRMVVYERHAWFSHNHVTWEKSDVRL